MRWNAILLSILYFGLVFLSAILPLVASRPGIEDPTELQKIQNTGFNIAVVGIIAVLFVPFLRLLDNITNTRTMVFKINKAVNRLDFPVTVKPRESHDDLLAVVNKYDSPIVYLGFRNPELLRTLLSVFRSKKRGALYINPRVLTTLIEIIDDGDTLPARTVYVTDCPRESCAVFGHDENKRINCVLFRYMPRRTIGRPDEPWWSATLSPGTSPDVDYPDYLYNTYDRHYRSGSAATLLTSPLKARFLCEVNQRRIGQNRHLIADHLPVLTRRLTYEYATSMLRYARKSIYAVDFMSPKVWIRKGGYIEDYIQAHPKDSAISKIRLHAFYKNLLARDAAEYLEFIQLHGTMNAEVRFIEEQEIRRLGITRGFVIIDDLMMVEVEDLHFVGDNEDVTLDDLDNRELDAREFCFTQQNVRAHRELFDRLLCMGRDKVLPPSAFERLISAPSVEG